MQSATAVVVDARVHRLASGAFVSLLALGALTVASTGRLSDAVRAADKWRSTVCSSEAGRACVAGSCAGACGLVASGTAVERNRDSAVSTSEESVARCADIFSNAASRRAVGSAVESCFALGAVESRLARGTSGRAGACAGRAVGTAAVGRFAVGSVESALANRALVESSARARPAVRAALEGNGAILSIESNLALGACVREGTEAVNTVRSTRVEELAARSVVSKCTCGARRGR